MKKIIILAIILIVVLCIASYDIYRFKNNENPLFTFSTKHFTEGGTTFSYGLGYQLINWHVLRYDEENESSYYLTRRDIHIFPFFVWSYPTELDEYTFVKVTE